MKPEGGDGALTYLHDRTKDAVCLIVRDGRTIPPPVPKLRLALFDS